MKKSFLLSLVFLFIASCSILPLDDENQSPQTEISLETTPLSPQKVKEENVKPFNQKIINAHNKKESWAQHAPEVVLHYLGRDLSASFTTLEFKSQPENFDYAEVEFTQDGLLDDDVKSKKTLIVLKKLPQGYWQFISAKVSTECYRNHTEEGHCL